MNGVHVCPECRQMCEFLSPKTKPEASEWYCPGCHKSYNVDGLTKDGFKS